MQSLVAIIVHMIAIATLNYYQSNKNPNDIYGDIERLIRLLFWIAIFRCYASDMFAPRNKRNTIQVPIFYVALLIEITTPVEGQQNFCQLHAAAENCIGNYKYLQRSLVQQIRLQRGRAARD